MKTIVLYTGAGVFLKGGNFKMVYAITYFTVVFWQLGPAKSVFHTKNNFTQQCTTKWQRLENNFSELECKTEFWFILTDSGFSSLFRCMILEKLTDCRMCCVRRKMIIPFSLWLTSIIICRSHIVSFFTGTKCFDTFQFLITSLFGELD